MVECVIEPVTGPGPLGIALMMRLRGCEDGGGGRLIEKHLVVSEIDNLE